jgi:D-glycero-alpha-D-manno-heptose-7-phosphate kinase
MYATIARGIDGYFVQHSVFQGHDMHRLATGLRTRHNSLLIRAKAPLRLGLAGGGTDVSPFCDKYGGCVLNAAISLHAYALLETRHDNRVKFIAADHEVEFEGNIDEDWEVPTSVLLHFGVYKRIMAQYCGDRSIPITLTTFSDAAAGSGLGSSSTLVVVMVEAFKELLGLPLGEYDVAHLAYEIERLDLGLNGGKQDQYAATFGGFNFMEFYDQHRVVVNPLRIKESVISELESSLILYYTGVSRESAKIINEQSNNIAKEDLQALAAMQMLKEDALTIKESLLKGDIRRMAEALGHSWKYKKQTAFNISNDNIERIFDIATKAGAYSGKVSGAGGGGFMMFMVDPAKKPAVLRALGKEPGGQAVTCQFSPEGARSWRVL